MNIKLYILMTVIILFGIHIYMVKRVDYSKHPFVIMMVMGVYWFGTAGLFFFGFILIV